MGGVCVCVSDLGLLVCGHWGGAYDGGMLVVFREVVLWGVGTGVVLCG